MRPPFDLPTKASTQDRPPTSNASPQQTQPPVYLTPPRTNPPKPQAKSSTQRGRHPGFLPKASKQNHRNPGSPCEPGHSEAIQRPRGNPPLAPASSKTLNNVGTPRASVPCRRARRVTSRRPLPPLQGRREAREESLRGWSAADDATAGTPGAAKVSEGELPHPELPPEDPLHLPDRCHSAARPPAVHRRNHHHHHPITIVDIIVTITIVDIIMRGFLPLAHSARKKVV